MSTVAAPTPSRIADIRRGVEAYMKVFGEGTGLPPLYWELLAAIDQRDAEIKALSGSEIIIRNLQYVLRSTRQDLVWERGHTAGVTGCPIDVCPYAGPPRAHANPRNKKQWKRGWYTGRATLKRMRRQWYAAHHPTTKEPTP